MMRFIALSALFLTLLMMPATAQDRAAIGNGRLFSNDYFGDGHDRWRTGSYVLSHLRGTAPYDGTAGDFGDIIEYRFRAEIIAPARRSGDRPYVGAMSAGVATHFSAGGLQYAVGADITAVGPQTGLGEMQRAFHKAFKLKEPLVDVAPLADATYLSGYASASYRHQMSDAVSLRPFVEAQTGVEDIFRVGGDVLIGPVAQNDLLLRDVVTGQLYRGTEDGTTGTTYVIGADFAAVGDSVFLPEDQGYVASETRTRARAGVHWQPSSDITFFYGVTYLSEEFDAQPEGQVLGSLRLNFNF